MNRDTTLGNRRFGAMVAGLLLAVAATLSVAAQDTEPATPPADNATVPAEGDGSDDAGERSFDDLLREYLSEGDRRARRQLEKDLVATVDGDVLALHEKLRNWGSVLPEDPRTGAFDLEYETDEHTETAQIFVPERYTPERSWPVLMLSHGTSGSGTQFRDAFQRMAAREKIILIAPTQTRGDPRWGVRPDQRLLHADALTAMARRYRLDPARVWIYGYSRGGHAAWDVSMHYPGTFAALFAGAGAPTMRVMRFLPNLRGMAIYEAVGGQDDALMIDSLHLTRDALDEMGIAMTLDVRPDDGHATRVTPDDVWNQVKGASRAVPTSIDLCTDENMPWRHTWLEVTRVDARAATVPRRIQMPQSYFRLPADKQRERMIDKMNEYRARVKIAFDAEHNRFDITSARHVKKLTLWLDPALVDFDRPVQVRFDNREIAAKTVRPNSKTALRWIRDHPVSALLPLASLDITIPRR